MTAVTGTFTATGQSGTYTPFVSARDTMGGRFNVSASGTFVGTVQIERSFDNQVSWFVCSSDGAGTAAAFTAPFSVVVEENDPAALYRVNCTAYTSGTVTYRVGR